VQSLGRQKIVHVALSIEGKRPHFEERIDAMRKKIAQVLKIRHAQVGITITTGDGLTDFGCGDGLQCFCVLSTIEEV
jgi:2-C-methyl-D-erythritol 2,4-cyclodiphosphate synthase